GVGCIVENQIKFATCTLLESALTWWNSHVTIVGPDVTYAMTSTNLRKKMTDKYCPRGEIKKLKDMKKKMTDKYCPRGEMKKLESELWNLREADKIERYVSGLPDVIHGSVMALRPTTMQEEIKMANELIDKRNNS
nr:hypothetical protein [Tanacetum cinerariifolium]